MADLMTATAEFSSLQKKYKDFTVPAAKITVGGTDLASKKDLTLAGVEAVLSLDSASSVTARFTNIYDRKNSKIDATLSSVQLGKTMELEIGYGSSTTKVFKGYVADIRTIVDINDGVAMEITALDARRLMMADNMHRTQHKIKNYSDAVDTVMKRYKGLCSVTSEATSENFEDAIIWQNCSDYDFIMKNLIHDGLCDREFFIVADKAYFRKPRSSASPIMTLGLGEGIISFTKEARYLDESVQVIGYDGKADKSVNGKVTAKQKDSQSSAIATGEYILTDPSCSSAASAKARAQAIADRKLYDSQRAELTTVGLPELVPGRFVKIDKIDQSVNKKYYITSVSHSYDEQGFITRCIMEGWE